MSYQLNIGLALFWLGSAGMGFAQTAGIVSGYTNDFSTATVESKPDRDELMVLSGDFIVREAEGNKYLELGGAPLDTFVCVFGPDFHPDKETRQEVTARVLGSATGRRYAAFGVGVCGLGGYRLQVTPGKRALELYRGEEVIAAQPYRWKSDAWTELRLRMIRQNDRWTVQGRVWTDDQAEPSDWLIEFTDKEPPVSGKASIWGIPFSGRPVLFDDLRYRIGS